MAFIFQFVNVVYYIDWFADIEESLHSWGKAHLVMVYDLFNVLWDVNGFGVVLSCLYIEAQGCVPVVLENLHGMSCSGTCWPLGGAWFQCRYGGVW